MTTLEFFDSITSKPKWYAGKFSRQYACRLINRHKSGNLSLNTYKSVFKHFGVELDKEVYYWRVTTKLH